MLLCFNLLNNKLRRYTATIYEQIYSEYQRINKQISKIERKLTTFPLGFLYITRKGKYFNWYHSYNHLSRYIPKKERQFAEKLAVKKFLTFQHEHLLQEKKAIEAYFKYHVVEDPKIAGLFAEGSGYRELLESYYKPVSQELCEWMNAPFEQNSSHPEQLIFKGASGNLLRSKSETIIDMLLHFNHLPYRYEAKLTLGQISLYPDFTIRHPKTGETYYWEHFGLMDNPSYARNAFQKMQLYNSNGIFPFVNLIMTFENHANPLSADVVENIVQHYFL